MQHQKTLIIILAVFILLLAGCAPVSPTDDEMILPENGPVSLAEGEKLAVVVSTSIIGDIVARVGGDSINLTELTSQEVFFESISVAVTT